MNIFFYFIFLMIFNAAQASHNNFFKEDNNELEIKEDWINNYSDPIAILKEDGLSNINEFEKEIYTNYVKDKTTQIKTQLTEKFQIACKNNTIINFMQLSDDEQQKNTGHFLNLWLLGFGESFDKNENDNTRIVFGEAELNIKKFKLPKNNIVIEKFLYHFFHNVSNEDLEKNTLEEIDSSFKEHLCESKEDLQIIKNFFNNNNFPAQWWKKNYCQGMISSHECKKKMGKSKIKYFSILKEFRGKGWGKKILEVHCASIFNDSQKIKKIFLKPLESATGFYKKCGFAVSKNNKEAARNPKLLFLEREVFTNMLNVTISKKNIYIKEGPSVQNITNFSQENNKKRKRSEKSKEEEEEEEEDIMKKKLKN